MRHLLNCLHGSPQCVIGFVYFSLWYLVWLGHSRWLLSLGTPRTARTSLRSVAHATRSVLAPGTVSDQPLTASSGARRVLLQALPTPRQTRRLGPRARFGPRTTSSST